MPVVIDGLCRAGLRRRSNAFGDTKSGMATPLPMSHGAVRNDRRPPKSRATDWPCVSHKNTARGVGPANSDVGLDLGISEFEFRSIAGPAGCPFAPGPTGQQLH